jgi:23S rRNA U2552 (ribose-2'-O)-methylase RlmE/FtsJ
MADRFKLVFRLERMDTKEEVFGLQQHIIDLGDDGVAKLRAARAAMKAVVAMGADLTAVPEGWGSIERIQAATMAGKWPKEVLQAAAAILSTYIADKLMDLPETVSDG